MKYLIIFLIIFFNIPKYRCEQLPCRTNCSNDECWREALNYRSSELIQQLFSLSSLSIYVDAFQRHHPDKIDDSIQFVNESLENHLINETAAASLDMNLFTETKQLLLNFCRNLTSVAIETVGQFPPLSCSTSTCSSDVRNYMVIFIISTITSSLILMICIVQAFQARRKSRSVLNVGQNGPLMNSLSTTHTSVNTQH